MSDAPDPRFLEVFPAYLRTLGEDATLLGDIVRNSRDESTRAGISHLVSALNYVFKSLDLIPDGVDDLGYLDDAFIVRVGCQLACETSPSLRIGVVERLASEAPDIGKFLGSDFSALVEYVKLLRKGAARGRTVEEIVSDNEVREAFLAEVAAWGKGYRPPPFTRDIRTLIKLKAYLNAKLS